MPRPNTKDVKLRFITRMRDPLWRVWVQFGDLDLGQAYFSDRGYGTTENALSEAMRHRDRLVAQHHIPLRIYAGDGFCIKNTRNSSGTVGITLMLDDPSNPTKVNWASRNMVNGKQQAVARSILKFGYAEAWRLVAEVRRTHTQLPISSSPPPPPDWLVAWLALRGKDAS